MYTFNYSTEENKQKHGGLYDVLDENGEQVAYLRIKYGIVSLYPMLDDEPAWGIVLGTWIFDDYNKTSLTDEEANTIKEESISLIDEFFED